ncbi:hypothetical protein SEUBUCD646_0B03020 [Saccharomyces eubayanus]|uniref:PXA domain-containing protein n=2 Tax=Saccharomyces TaxID=4930 RepID=A0A6C1E4Q3_SACPS|nr:hypothetical protein GRS66_005980 [Saccharomyces pastorianus]CAI1830983.1 hypothetical protein SEUBUCD650_0B03030 [Saccharomyces eubayanus]CAI1865589.1 hypothetical protein SEUBUCD646_0B03020 [Saccharomyces eubayanus]
MPTILYNTNSSLISKYRRSNASKPYKGLPSKKAHKRLSLPPDIFKEESGYTRNCNDDISFQSEFEKDSVGYLQDLCCSVYPSSLHQRIKNLRGSPDLQINAFIALIFKNFIKSWYGVKIPTNDSKFLTELYNLVQNLVKYMKNSQIDYGSLLLDYIPCLVSSHLKALRDCPQDTNLVYEHYCQLTLYDSKRYPGLFIDIIQNKMNTKSLLQRSFLDSFLNELVFGHILDSIIEPYHLLNGLNIICKKIKLRSAMNPKESSTDEKSKAGAWSFVGKIKHKISQVGKLVSYSTSMKSPNMDSTGIPEIPFLQRYIFTFILVDFFKLPMRKPFLFSMCRTFQCWISKSKFLNKMMYRMFANTAQAKITDPTILGGLFVSLRHSLFPNDSAMGPPKTIPIDDAFLEFRGECVSNVWDVCIAYRIDKILAIKKFDIEEVIHSLSKDRDCNKLLLYRAMDCVAAQLP